MELKLDLPSQQVLVADAERTLTEAKAYVIDSPEMYQLAATELATIKGRAKTLEERRRAITKPLDEAKAAVMALFKPAVETLVKAEQVIKQAIGNYDDEQERKRRVEEERLRRIAEEERERLRKEAEKAERLAAEKAEKQRQEAERLRAAGEAAKAAQLEAKAEQTVAKAQDKAESLQAEAEQIPTPVVVHAPPKVSGLSSTDIWKARVIDVNALPREYMIPNESALDKIAKATKGQIVIPGVEFYSEKSVRSASRR